MKQPERFFLLPVLLLICLTLLSGCSLHQTKTSQKNAADEYLFVVPKNSNIVYASENPGKRVMIALSSPQSVEQLRNYYRMAAQKEGWLYKSQLLLNDGVLLLFDKGKQRMEVSITARKERSNVIVVIDYTN